MLKPGQIGIVVVASLTLAGCASNGATTATTGKATASTTPSSAPPATTTPPATAPHESVKAWVAANGSKLTAFSTATNNARKALATVVSNPGPQQIANTIAACSAMGAQAISAVGWTIPPGQARDDLLTTITQTSQLAHDCLAVTSATTSSDLQSAMSGVVADETALTASTSAFVKAAS